MQINSFSIIVPPAPQCAECDEQTSKYESTGKIPYKPEQRGKNKGETAQQVEAVCPNGHVNIYTYEKRYVWRWDEKCGLTAKCQNRRIKGDKYCLSCVKTLREAGIKV